MQEHLTKRRLDPGKYKGLQLNKDSAVFLLWKLSGQLVGYQQYSPNAPKPNPNNRDARHPSEKKYYTFLGKQGGEVKKPTALLAAFGVELLDKSKKVVFLAEGVFDVSPLHNRGVNALATLCNDPKHLKGWLLSQGYTLVALAEGDKAGKRLAKFAHYVEWLPEGKDPGDMPDEWFDKLVEKYKC